MTSILGLTSKEIRALSPEHTVFFLPVGPIEDHGAHLGMGIDLMEAARVSEIVAERLERERNPLKCVLLPATPLAIESNTGEIAITHRPHVLRDYLIDTCLSLHRAGFRYFVCVSGHLGPKQLTAIEEASRLVYRKSRRMLAWGKGSNPRACLMAASAALVTFQDFRRSPLFLDAPEHGGTRDTSVGFALSLSRPESLHTHAALPPSDSRMGRFYRHRLKKISGYWGDPSLANKEHGLKIMEATAQELYPKICAVLEGASPHKVFRTWYGILPFHKSFFQSWMLAFSLTCLLLFWAYLSLRLVVID